MTYELDFLPVGENTKSGDAILFRFWDSANGETVEDQKICLIDGGYSENGKKIEEHMNKYYGTNKIDLVISTHPDLDHIGGLSYILENLEVKELWMHTPWNMTDGLSDCFKDGRITDNSLANRLKEGLDKACNLEKIAKEKGVNICNPFTGLSAFGGVIRVLSPTEDFYKELLKEFRCTPEPVTEEALSFADKIVAELKKIIAKWGIDNLEKNPETTAENNSSVVLLISADDKQLLLTADAGVSALANAADEIEKLGFSSNCASYVQVPHHGSKHNVNTEILNRLIGTCVDKNSEPTKNGAVSICVEDDGKHPSKAVLNAFKQRGVDICKTKGSKLWHHSKDAPAREDYSTAQPYDFFEVLEVEA